MNNMGMAPVQLSGNSKSYKVKDWFKRGNRFYDRLLKWIYVCLLFLLNFEVFIYAYNGNILENGEVNPALFYIAGGVAAGSLILVLLVSFIKEGGNVFCALLTMLFTVIFFNQYALFDFENFIDTWFMEHASWLSFIIFIPSHWLTGLLLGGIIYVLFHYTLGIFLTNVGLILVGGLVFMQTDLLENPSGTEYQTVVSLPAEVQGKKQDNIIYFMAPKLPSYHFLGSLRDPDLRDLRDMLIGFYAINGFEVYPNAFVQNDESFSNVIDLYNLVDYTSAKSANRGFGTVVNPWNYRYDMLDEWTLDRNELYAALKKDDAYKISTYSMPAFNLCVTDDAVNTDRCVFKNIKKIKFYDSKSTLEKNIYAILGEWVLSWRSRDMKQLAKLLLDESAKRKFKVLADNRRLSIEGSVHVFDELLQAYKADKNGQVYMVYVDLPSDEYIYDEYCRLKPRSQWVALKDSAVYTVGIDEKRKAYVDQAKCFIGKMQEFMDAFKQNKKSAKTDVIVQGVSNLKELGDLQVGRYANFVKDKLTNLAIRHKENPQFIINTEICLASDEVRSLLFGKRYCYGVDDMKLTVDEEHNLKQNLIHNAVVRGSKITNITANYLDWYEEFKNVNLILEKEKRQKEAAKKAKAKQEEQEKLAREQAQAEIAQNQAEVTEEIAPQEEVEQQTEEAAPQTEEDLPVPSVLLEAEPEPVSGIENLLLPEKN